MTKSALTMEDAAVTFDGVAKNFGEVKALDNVSLAISRGEFMTLLGPSGCGKTTLLKLAAGFLAPDSGTVAIDGKCVNDVPTYKREIGMMFQNYALFPHMSVAENIAFGLEMRKMAKAEMAPKITEALLQKGYSEGDVKKILGENTLRVMSEVEHVSRELNGRK